MYEVFRNVGAGPVVHRLILTHASEGGTKVGIEDIEVFIGIGVGRNKHWATALSRGGQKALDKALPNDEDRLCEVYQRLQAKGWVLVVVDQPTTIGALTMTMAQDMGTTAGYLSGLSMRHITDLTPDSVKTGARGAVVIAQAARAMPHTLRAISTSDEDAITLSMLTGFDLDLTYQVNQAANRIRGLCTQIHSALERVLRPWLEYDAVLEVIATWPIPAGLKQAGKTGIDARFKKHECRRHATWTGRIVSILGHQTIVVAGTDATAVVLPHLARQLIVLHAQRADATVQVETLVQAYLLYQVLTSVPGIGVRTTAVFLAETLGKTFNADTQLASYARFAPIMRRSGPPIRGEHTSHGSNKKLRRVMFLSAFTPLRSDPVSRAYYQHKQDQGRRRNQAVLAPAHRRILALHAIIRNGVLYDPQPATKLPAAT